MVELETLASLHSSLVIPELHSPVPDCTVQQLHQLQQRMARLASKPAAAVHRCLGRAPCSEGPSPAMQKAPSSHRPSRVRQQAASNAAQIKDLLRPWTTRASPWSG